MSINHDIVPVSFSKLVSDPSNWVYGSQERDKILLHTPSKLPRFGHLARKAYMHYAGDRYNPHTIPTEYEFVMRDLIKGMIEYKVHGKVKDYDWEVIDILLIRIVNSHLDLDLPYNQKRLDEGLNPQFKSPFHDLETQIPN